jgi:phasin family protein
MRRAFSIRINRLQSCCNAQKVLDTPFWCAMMESRLLQRTKRETVIDTKVLSISKQNPRTGSPSGYEDMTLPTPEQFAASQKAGFEALFGLTNKAFEGAIKLAELNIQTARETFAQGQENVQAALAAKDPQGFFALQAGFAQPVAEKAIAYGRSVYEIVSAAQSEITRAAEAQFAQQQEAVQSLVENAAKNAPAGSESVVAAFKSAFNTANTAYETVNKAAKQAVELAESNIEAATKVATKAATTRAAKQSV